VLPSSVQFYILLLDLKKNVKRSEKVDHVFYAQEKYRLLVGILRMSDKVQKNPSNGEKAVKRIFFNFFFAHYIITKFGKDPFRT
jgi:hypothetical protein